MTTSEKHFENFCRHAGLEFTRLPESDKQTADYQIVLAGQKMIVEVKEIEANESESQAYCRLRENSSATWGVGKIGNRIRNKVEAGKRQIEALAAGKYPGILLIYDARPPGIRGIWPYEIVVAMLGFETIDLHPAPNPSEPVKFGSHRFGKNKKFRHNSHTYISAIGILLEAEIEGKFHINLYCNPYAEHPLPIDDIVSRSDMSIFIIGPGRGDEFRGFVQVGCNIINQ